MTTARISRNHPCPCGSGKKYKKCCLTSSTSASRFSWPYASERVTPRLPASFLPTTVRTSASSKKWNEVVFDASLKDGGRLHAVLLYSDGELNAGLIRKGEVVTLELTDVGFRGPATVVTIQRSSVQGDVEAAVLRLVRFRDDDDLGKVLYGQWTPPQDFVKHWASRRRTIVMRMDFPDGRRCDIELLRSVNWMEQHGVRVGGAVFLDLTDVGVRGWANVLEILPCPTPEDFGDGEMATGTFKYSHGHIGELVLASETKPIGVTPWHLFWSEDQQTWVQVSQLRMGETVQSLNGLTRVVSFTMTDLVEPVYNIEVIYDHCYRVGETGVLVHNQSGQECQTYVGGLSTKAASSGTSIDAVFQRRACGTTVYVISGGGKTFDADGIEGCTVIDCKAVRTPQSSPALGTADPRFWPIFEASELEKLRRLETVISDPCNPLEDLLIVVDRQDVVPFWQSLASSLSIPVRVEVR